MSDILLLSIISCDILTTHAQNHANIWYFGQNEGVDFNNGSPVAITNGALTSVEGCASISDQNGDILFYTNGMTLWKKNNLQMTNGAGLLGDSSATKSAVFIKKQN